MILQRQMKVEQQKISREEGELFGKDKSSVSIKDIKSFYREKILFEEGLVESISWATYSRWKEKEGQNLEGGGNLLIKMQLFQEVRQMYELDKSKLQEYIEGLNKKLEVKNMDKINIETLNRVFRQKGEDLFRSYVQLLQIQKKGKDQKQTSSNIAPAKEQGYQKLDINKNQVSQDKKQVNAIQKQAGDRYNQIRISKALQFATKYLKKRQALNAFNQQSDKLSISFMHQQGLPQQSLAFQFTIVAPDQAYSLPKKTQILLIEVVLGSEDDQKQIQNRVKSNKMLSQNCKLEVQSDNKKMKIILKFEQERSMMDQFSNIVGVQEQRKFKLEMKTTLGLPAYKKQKPLDCKFLECIGKGCAISLDIEGDAETIAKIRANLLKENQFSKLYLLISLSKESKMKIKLSKIDDFKNFFEKIGLAQVIKQATPIKQILKEQLQSLFSFHPSFDFSINKFLTSTFENKSYESIAISRFGSNSMLRLSLPQSSTIFPLFYQK